MRNPCTFGAHLLHRETHSIGPMMLFLAIVAICVAGSLVVSMLAKKPKHEEEEEE